LSASSVRIARDGGCDASFETYERTRDRLLTSTRDAVAFAPQGNWDIYKGALASTFKLAMQLKFTTKPINI